MPTEASGAAHMMRVSFHDPNFHVLPMPAAAGPETALITSTHVYPTADDAFAALDQLLAAVPAAAIVMPLMVAVVPAITDQVHHGTPVQIAGYRIVSTGAGHPDVVLEQTRTLRAAAVELSGVAA